MQVFVQHLAAIKNLCQQHNVTSLFAFGSVTRGDFRPESDIDLIVDIADTDPLAYSEHYFGLKFKLEELFKRKVDLLEERALRNIYVKQNIEKTKVLIYGR